MTVSDEKRSRCAYSDHSGVGTVVNAIAVVNASATIQKPRRWRAGVAGGRASLFDRSTHHVRLTDAGRALLPAARATLAAAQAARDAVGEAQGGLRGRVVLGTMQAQGMRAIDLAGVLAAFRAQHPGVEVAIRHSAKWPARSSTAAWISRLSRFRATLHPG